MYVCNAGVIQVSVWERETSIAALSNCTCIANQDRFDFLCADIPGSLAWTSLTIRCSECGRLIFFKHCESQYSITDWFQIPSFTFTSAGMVYGAVVIVEAVGGSLSDPWDSKVSWWNFSLTPASVTPLFILRKIRFKWISQSGGTQGILAACILEWCKKDKTS